jgi:hypothetical protein
MNSQDFSKLLIVSDQLSSFSLFQPAKSESALAATEGILQWIAFFGTPKGLLSDQSPAFVNEVIKELNDLTTAKAHWSNGKAERRNGIIAGFFRKILSENKMVETDWHLLIPIVQMAFNHATVKSLGGFAPVSVFCGLEPSHPIDVFFDPVNRKWRKIEVKQQDFKIFAEELHGILVHREAQVHELQEQTFFRSQAKRNLQRGVKPLNVEIGDYVMTLDQPDTKMRSKLSPRWIGPARIIKIINKQRYLVEYLAPRGEKTREVHATHIQFFDYATMRVTKKLKDTAEYLSQKTYNVEEVLDIQYDKKSKEYYLEVSWENYDETTWEPATRLYKDVPHFVKEYLANSPPDRQKIAKEASKKLRITV